MKIYRVTGSQEKRFGKVGRNGEGLGREVLDCLEVCASCCRHTHFFTLVMKKQKPNICFNLTTERIAGENSLT